MSMSQSASSRDPQRDPQHDPQRDPYDPYYDPRNRSQRFRLRSTGRLTTLLTVLAILIALFAVINSYRQDDGPDPSMDVPEKVTRDEALLILERADDASNQAGNILSFLEVLLAIAGFLGAGLVWIVRGTLENTEKDVRELMRQLEDRFYNREQALVTLEQELRQEVRAMREATTEQMQEAQHMAQNAFRVLRLQLLAEQQVRAHNFDSAIDTLEHAYNTDPNDHATNYLLGYLYTRKDVNQAIRYLERALELESNFTPGIAALGLTLRRKGDKITDPDRFDERDRLWAQAESKLREALNRDPRLTDADGQSYYGSLGGLYRRQKHYYAAIDAYERAHKVTPASSYPLINLASIHKYLGNDEDAIYYFREVAEGAELTLDDNPRDLWTRCDYAQALMVLGQRAEAMKQVNILLEQEPNPGILETVLDGLRFLANVPTPIPHLPDMIAELEAAQERLRAAELARREGGGED